MNIKPIARFRSPLKEKFGIPRQAGLSPDLKGEIILMPEYSQPDCLRGLEGFDYLWLIWGFNTQTWSPTVRPPRLGGNKRVGVFASRSPFRPNPLGLSSVKIDSIAQEGIIKVSGADLMDGSLIYDIKPYISYADAHPMARSGFVDNSLWRPLKLIIPEEIASEFSPEDIRALRQILEQDPRPQYQDDPTRVYGLLYGEYNIKFRIEGEVLEVLETQIIDP